VERIVGAAITRGGAMAFLKTLTDTIGGRVTGSPQSLAASELILKVLKEAEFDDAHIDDAHIEDYPPTSRGQRGPASGRGSESGKATDPGRILRRSRRWQALRRSGKVARCGRTGRSDKCHRSFISDDQSFVVVGVPTLSPFSRTGD